MGLNPLYQSAIAAYQRRKRKRGQSWQQKWPRYSEESVSSKLLLDILFLLAGVAAAAFGLRQMILPNGLIDGGTVGLSLLLDRLIHWPLELLLFLLNLPFLLLGFFVANRRFVIKSVFALAGLSVVLVFWPEIPLTKEPLLGAVFGGAAIGVGMGLTLRGGGALDGTDILAFFLSRKSGVHFSDVVLVVNGLIFLSAAIILQLEAALYSMLAYFVAARSMEYVLHGHNQYLGVNIVTQQPEAISKLLTQKLQYGATVFHAERGRTLSSPASLPSSLGPQAPHGQQQTIRVVLCILNRLDLARVTRYVRETDPYAFVYTFPVSDTVGGFLRKQPLERLSE